MKHPVQLIERMEFEHNWAPTIQRPIRDRANVDMWE